MGFFRVDRDIQAVYFLRQSSQSDAFPLRDGIAEIAEMREFNILALEAVLKCFGNFSTEPLNPLIESLPISVVLKCIGQIC